MHYPLANDRRSLQWLANQNTITLHVWPSRAPRLDRPDLCVFDLDPSRDEPELLREALAALRDLLDELGHPSWVKTSGSKGFHIVVPLKRRATFATPRALPIRSPASWSSGSRASHAGVQQGRSRRPHLHRHRPQPRRRDVRRGLHGAREARRAGVGAVHVGRSRRGHGAPQTFTLRTMPARLAQVGDLWADLVPRRGAGTRGQS